MLPWPLGFGRRCCRRGGTAPSTASSEATGQNHRRARRRPCLYKQIEVQTHRATRTANNNCAGQRGKCDICPDRGACVGADPSSRGTPRVHETQLISPSWSCFTCWGPCGEQVLPSIFTSSSSINKHDQTGVSIVMMSIRDLPFEQRGRKQHEHDPAPAWYACWRVTFYKQFYFLGLQ